MVQRNHSFEVDLHVRFNGAQHLLLNLKYHGEFLINVILIAFEMLP